MCTCFLIFGFETEKSIYFNKKHVSFKIQIQIKSKLSICTKQLAVWRCSMDLKKAVSPSFLVTWSWNEGLSKQPLPDVRNFLTSGHAYEEVTNITAHAQNGFLSLTAPLGKKCYFLSSLQRVASLGCFENTDFTQLGSTDNLESKGAHINKNQLNTLLGCRTEFSFDESKHWEFKQDRGDRKSV